MGLPVLEYIIQCGKNSKLHITFLKFYVCIINRLQLLNCRQRIINAIERRYLPSKKWWSGRLPFMCTGSGCNTSDIMRTHTCSTNTYTKKKKKKHCRSLNKKENSTIKKLINLTSRQVRFSPDFMPGEQTTVKCSKIIYHLFNV